MSLNNIKKYIATHKNDILEHITNKSLESTLPLYASVDIRINAHKAAVVDTNIFPAGFNNLCQHGAEHIPINFKQTILTLVPHCQNILILCEAHTRNTFYLDHLNALSGFLHDAGFNTTIASLQHESNTPHMELTTSNNTPIKIHNFNALLTSITDFDFVLLNNDLIHGIPEPLKTLQIPTYPSYAAGWHSRIKSEHFKHVNMLAKNLSTDFDIDPFFITTAFSEVPNCDIQSELDRNRLHEQATKLYTTLEQQYAYYNIPDTPHLFIKANKGTYGMGVTSINHPDEILSLNRKNRNKLTKGKESHRITDLIIQEGIPSSLRIQNNVAELCLYYASKHYLGGFYRLNSQKGDRDNLNSKGMNFQKMCINNRNDPSLHPLETCGLTLIEELDFYEVLGLISVYAAQQEIHHLEALHA